MNNKNNNINMPIWLSSDGEKISCNEKLKVMQQNIIELKQVAQDTFEDGVLMGIDPKQLKAYLQQLVNDLNNVYHT